MRLLGHQRNNTVAAVTNQGAAQLMEASIMTNTNTTLVPTKTVAKSNTAKDLNTQLDNLCKVREEWELGAYKTSNDQLYEILACCLDIFQQLRSDIKQRKLFKEKLDAMKAKNLIVFNEGTNLPTRIVRYVFRNNGKRSFAYAKALIAANEAKVDSLGLARWIANNGGVEQVRRTPKNGVTPAVLNANLQQSATQHYSDCKCLVTPFKAPKQLLPDAEGTNNFALALVRKEDDGRITIVYGTNKSTLVKHMLTVAGKHLAETKGKAAVAGKRRSQKTARLAAVKAA